jgi:hypothetical protein
MPLLFLIFSQSVKSLSILLILLLSLHNSREYLSICKL